MTWMTGSGKLHGSDGLPHERPVKAERYVACHRAVGRETRYAVLELHLERSKQNILPTPHLPSERPKALPSGTKGKTF